MSDRSIAYFSMEIALEAALPTYSGGLGVLAGDTIKTGADLNLPLVAVTLLHRKGYFRQHLDSVGQQTEEPAQWRVEQFLEELPQRVEVPLDGRTVFLRAWKYVVKGQGGFTVPIYFLDADLPRNDERDRTLTHYLYGGDTRYRLSQEILLGIGGVRMLRAIGHVNIQRFHMNEGHSSLLTLELLDEQARLANRPSFNLQDIDVVRKHCVFTTHTPVPAGHDQFPRALVDELLHRPEIYDMPNIFCCDGMLNLTYVALNLSRYINGVAKRHGEISRLQYAQYEIDSITNGVHVGTWLAPSMERLFDRYIPEWRADNFSLRYALSIHPDELWQAHLDAKQELLERVNQLNGVRMRDDVMTIGFARRSTAYKRANLLFYDIDRIKKLAASSGPIQIIYAGKAHPHDDPGKAIIRRIFDAARKLKGEVPIAYLENYDMELAKLMTAGVDLWLNTPQPPLEASGTSGMKAAINGVPSLSILDGWWIEGHINNTTGWAFGEHDHENLPADHRDERDAASLYTMLEQVVLPLYYRQRDRYIDVMRHAIALNGSFFNTQRMLKQYALRAYLV